MTSCSFIKLIFLKPKVSTTTKNITDPNSNPRRTMLQQQQFFAGQLEKCRRLKRIINTRCTCNVRFHIPPKKVNIPPARERRVWTTPVAWLNPILGPLLFIKMKVLIFGQKVVLDQSCTILYFWLYQQVDKNVKFWRYRHSFHSKWWCPSCRVIHNTSQWVLKAFEWGSIKYEIFKSESIWAFIATNIIEQLVDEISTMKY